MSAWPPIPWTWTCFACAAVACAPAIKQPDSGPTRAPTAAEDVCTRAVAEAEALRSQGRLWHATRRLQSCGEPNSALAREIAGDLGQGRAVTQQAPNGEDLTRVESWLAGGQCLRALEEAERLYASSVPSPIAAVLAGRAAACLARTSAEQRWYARAMFELELGAQRRGWALAPQVESVRWLDSATVAVSTKSGAAELHRRAGSGQWSWDAATTTPSPSRVGDEPIVDLKTGGELTVRDGKTKALLWRRELSPLAEFHATSRAGQRLLLWRDPNAFLIHYEFVELKTGRSVKRGSAEGVLLRNVVSSPFTSWFSFETPDRDERDISYVLIDDDGRQTRQKLGQGCAPLAAWTKNELLSDCGEASLYAIDVRTKARRKLGAKPPGSFRNVESLAERVTSFSGAGGAFVLRESAPGEAAIVTADLAGVDLSGGVSWSPDASRFAALGSSSNGGRRAFVIWNLAEARVETRWDSYSQTWPGQRMGFALSRSREQLALGGCPELQLLDLRSGAFSATPGSVCAPILVPTSESRFVVIDDDGTARSWAPPRAPLTIAGLTVQPAANAAQAAGDWLAVTRGGTSPLIHLPSASRLELPDQAQVRAISPDATHVVYSTRREVAGKVELGLALARLEVQPLGAVERFRTSGSGKSRAVFSRDGRQLYFKTGGPNDAHPWQVLDVATLAAAPAPQGNALDGAVELSTDGSRILRPSTLSLAGGERPLQLAHSGEDAEQLKPRGPLFAADDRLVVARRGGSVLLWRARDASFLGRIEPLAAGGALFTPAIPADAKEQAPSSSLVQLFGAAEQSLRCVVGDRLYDWAVCADRFEAADLLTRTLATAVE